MLRSGRGAGKTRTGAEFVRARVESGRFGRIALVGQTKGDVRDTMIEVGESSILQISPPWFYPDYEPSKRRLTWPNGAVAIVYSGDEPGQLRGPQHDTAWIDELAKFKYPEETMDNLEFGLRIGPDPRGVITTTPKPIPIIRQYIADPDVHDTRVSTYDNLANLSPRFIQRVLRRYEGTTLGAQELHGILLEDMPGALWKRAELDAHRVREVGTDLLYVTVGVDPQASTTAPGAGTGIVVGGLGRDGQGYVLDDMSLSESPAGWASQAITAYHKHQADKIVAEINNGGDMVVHTIHSIDDKIPVETVHASRGKRTRAEPVSALYQQGRIHHVGTFGDLEDELCSWVPGEGEDSPHRLDALVWVFTDLMVDDLGTLEEGPDPTAGHRGG